MKKIFWVLTVTFTFATATARLSSQEENESNGNGEPQVLTIVDDLNIFEKDEADREDVEYFLLNEDGTLTSLEYEEAYAHISVGAGKIIKKRKTRNCEVKQGKASWYGPGFAGNLTANGERFDPNELTAAHKTLRFNSIVRVTYGGRSVDVRINDDGPHIKGRVIDLSKAAAQKIGLIAAGHAKVTIELIECG